MCEMSTGMGKTKAVFFSAPEIRTMRSTGASTRMIPGPLRRGSSRPQTESDATLVLTQNLD